MKEELHRENARLKKMLEQALERQAHAPVMLRPLDQAYLDMCCVEAMAFAREEYKHLCFNIYWKKDYSL